MFCLAELLLCHLCLFLRTGQIQQFSVPHSNSRSEQTITVNKCSFIFLFRNTCKEHLLWKCVILYCNRESHFQDWGCISGYVLPAGEKPCTAAGCWQTMPTSKPQLWNCGAVRGDARSPLGLAWVRSSEQTSIKKPGKGWSTTGLFFLIHRKKKKWEGMTEKPFSSLFFYMYWYFSEGFLMFYWKWGWNMKLPIWKCELIPVFVL